MTEMGSLELDSLRAEGETNSLISKVSRGKDLSSPGPDYDSIAPD